MKRVFLFIITNLAVVLVLSLVLNIVFSIFNINPNGISGLLVFSAVFGFGGAIISLLISKWMAIRTTGARIITNNSSILKEQWLLNLVAKQAKQLNLAMPEVAIFDTPEMNAFATGATKNKALVAVSSGLLNQMTDDEIEAVVGHEMSHIANGDMVTLTLIQGIVNTFVIFFVTNNRIFYK